VLTAVRSDRRSAGKTLAVSAGFETADTGAIVGASVIRNPAGTSDTHNRVGDHVHMAPGVHLGGDVTVGEGALAA